MTRIWYDCEFLENGRKIDLISIGLVREENGTGRIEDTLYLVNEEVDEDPLKDRIRNHQWLMDNVIPHLPLRGKGVSKGYDGLKASYNLDSDTNTVVSLNYIRNAVRDFVLGTGDPELWAWYGAYDHVTLCQLFGPMVKLPQGMPMWTNDLKQEVARLERRYALSAGLRLPTDIDRPAHDALQDALQLRDWHLYLEQWEADREADARAA